MIKGVALILARDFRGNALVISHIFFGEFVGRKVLQHVAGRWSEAEPPVIQSYILAP